MLSRLRSLRHKLNWVVLTTTFVALVLASLAMVLFDLDNDQKAARDDLLTQARLLGLAAVPALASNDARAASDNLELLTAFPTITRAAVYRADGSVLAQYARDEAAGALPQAAPPEGVRLEGRHLVAFRPIAQRGQALGAVYLRAERPWLGQLRNYLTMLAFVIAGTLGLALVVSTALLTLVTQPIRAVSDVARRITAGHDYSLRATRTTNDEIGEVVDAFNAMLDELARRSETLEECVRLRTAQLEIANRELEAFSYSASHDLRAPLRVIDSFSSLLEQSAGDALGERSRHYLDRIRFNVRHMAGLIDALLALAHVSRTGLRREPVDVGALAAAALDQCREREPTREARVEIAGGMLAQADAALLSQVMQNLVDNAWKFTSRIPNPTITVGCETPPDSSTVYYVRDNGAGFDMSQADNLFQAFQRLHTPSEFPGTGIGLATVQRIIARHEGRIWAQAEPGKGAAFFFTLGEEPRRGPAP